jgi:PDZ domain-containing protein
VAEVATVVPGGPAEGELQPEDEILAVDGIQVDSSSELVDAVRAAEPGDALELAVRSDDDRRVVQVVTAEEDGRTTIGISVATTYTMPFDVTFNLERNIGGPSAGTIFALAIYDKLTKGDLTGGRVIAGTGEVDYDGTVGAIGGIQQKIVSATNDGATIFLAPADNCADAVQAPVDSDDIRLVRIDSLDGAIAALQALAENPDADVPTCEAP